MFFKNWGQLKLLGQVLAVCLQETLALCISDHSENQAFV